MELKGLATGIGSLPHKNLPEALESVFKYTPQIPFWPQLPKRDVRESMIVQFSENLPCLQVTQNGLVFSSEDKEKKLEEFYEKIIANDVNYFGISSAFASGLHSFRSYLKSVRPVNIEFIKCQVTGPFTFAASVTDDKGVALLHDAVFMQAISKGLLMKALWQIEFFKEFKKSIIMFVDEPYLACFGSAYTPINREEVVSGLTELTQKIKSRDVLVGIHCCGNTDWSLFTDIKTIDIISFDAFSFLDRLLLYADNLKAFFKRNGILCWGIVPTTEFTGRETTDLLVEKIRDGINALVKKGLGRELLLTNLLLSPSCGLGILDTGKAERIFKLLSETAVSMKTSF